MLAGGCRWSAMLVGVGAIACVPIVRLTVGLVEAPVVEVLGVAACRS